MPRLRRNFDRVSGIKDPSLIVIATEGELTEQDYFNSIKHKLDTNENSQSQRLKLEVLDASIDDDEIRKKGSSSPSAVLEQLDYHAKRFGIGEFDELCLVIDRDKQSWTEKELSDVAKQCSSKRFFLALSNPSFEIWLLLHFQELSMLDNQDMKLVEENKKGYLKKYLKKFNVNVEKLDLDVLWPKSDVAIKRAKAMDTEPKDRWPNSIGTRVYVVVEKIKSSFML